MIFPISILFFFAIIAMIALRMMRHMPAQEGGNDVAVYKDQMNSLTKDLQNGVITEVEFENLRAEIGRRLIAAAKRAPQMPRSLNGASSHIILALICAAGVAAAGLYYMIGAPNTPDMGLQGRIEQSNTLILNLKSQAEAEMQAPSAAPTVDNTEYIELVERLRAELQNRPADVAGLTLLVRSESNLGNFSAARSAQQALIELKGAQASADDWYRLSEFSMAATNGYISQEGEAALRRALQKDQAHAMTRLRIGQLYLQVGRPDLTFDIWAQLLEEGPESAPYIPLIRSQIDDLAYFAGQFRYTQPATKGPSAADIATAESLSVAERSEMINAMVANLSDRLATTGGPAADWARLINAHVALGQIDEARAIYNEALRVFAGREDDLEILQNAARNGGITE